MAKKKAVKKARPKSKTSSDVDHLGHMVELINQNEKLQGDLLLVSEEVARLLNENAGLKAHVEQLQADLDRTNRDCMEANEAAEELNQQNEDLERENDACNSALARCDKTFHKTLSIVENLAKAMVG